jgi:pimeloyl-ACP methyl ester carboxylesterase
VTDTPIFEPDGRAIPYAAEGDGPALVLIAGLGLNVAYLGGLAHSVATEDFRVVRIGSRRPSKDGGAVVSMQDLAQDVVHVMDHLGVDHAWVGGHGFGGSVARTVSHDHPERVNGVLLMGVEGEAPSEPDFSRVSDDVRDAEAEPLQRAARAALGGQSPALAEGVPVLVLQGTADRITPAANGERLAAQAPDRVSVVDIQGGGHMFPATHIGATSWAIEDYLDWD